MHDPPYTAEQKAEFAAYGAGFSHAFGEAFEKGFGQGFGAGQGAFRAKVIACLEEGMEVPEPLVHLLRSTD